MCVSILTYNAPTLRSDNLLCVYVYLYTYLHYTAAHAIAEECEASNVICSVIGVPKSIDNDILLVSCWRN